MDSGLNNSSSVNAKSKPEKILNCKVWFEGEF